MCPRRLSRKPGLHSHTSDLSVGSQHTSNAPILTHVRAQAPGKEGQPRWVPSTQGGGARACCLTWDAWVAAGHTWSDTSPRLSHCSQWTVEESRPGHMCPRKPHHLRNPNTSCAISSNLQPQWTPRSRFKSQASGLCGWDWAPPSHGTHPVRSLCPRSPGAPHPSDAVPALGRL